MAQDLLIRSRLLAEDGEPAQSSAAAPEYPAIDMSGGLAALFVALYVAQPATDIQKVLFTQTTWPADKVAPGPVPESHCRVLPGVRTSL